MVGTASVGMAKGECNMMGAIETIRQEEKSSAVRSQKSFCCQWWT